MVIQSLVYPESVCNCPELYYQSRDRIENDENGLNIPKGGMLSFFSYMNMFDIDVWKKYTLVKNIKFVMEVNGKGKILFLSKSNEIAKIVESKSFNTLELGRSQSISFELDVTKYTGICYCDVYAEENIQIKCGRFEASKVYDENRDIYISLNICTYKRGKQLEENLNKLSKTRFFDKYDELYNRLNIVVVDNASEHKVMDEGNIKLLHNKNTGGSGGFKRGLEEIKKAYGQTTHVVFMDDDVEFIEESIYRMYALLKYISRKYEQEPIAGRMFRADSRYIQYTAAEIWNKGELRHIGYNADMRDESCVIESNKNEGAEYGGWWFCCYPMTFARENEPLPFFLHCDDVEYGLRHGGTPIVLNGIQVWHETFEYRQSPMILYYDVRNRNFVNALYGLETKEQLVARWKKIISEKHVKQAWNEEKMAIYAYRDFCRGMRWLKCHNPEKWHRRLMKKKNNSSRIYNAFLWRYVYMICHIRTKMRKEP